MGRRCGCLHDCDLSEGLWVLLVSINLGWVISFEGRAVIEGSVVVPVVAADALAVRISLCPLDEREH